MPSDHASRCRRRGRWTGSPNGTAVSRMIAARCATGRAVAVLHGPRATVRGGGHAGQAVPRALASRRKGSRACPENWVRSGGAPARSSRSVQGALGRSREADRSPNNAGRRSLLQSRGTWVRTSATRPRARTASARFRRRGRQATWLRPRSRFSPRRAERAAPQPSARRRGRRPDGEPSGRSCGPGSRHQERGIRSAIAGGRRGDRRRASPRYRFEIARGRMAAFDRSPAPRRRDRREWHKLRDGPSAGLHVWATSVWPSRIVVPLPPSAPAQSMS